MNRTTEETFRKLQGALPELFAKDAYPPFQVSVDGIVTIEIDARMQVSAVTIAGVGLTPQHSQMLEQALVAAINQATREVASRNVERIQQYLKG